MAFRRGTEQAEKAQAKKGGQGIHWFGLDDGQSITLRFLTDMNPHVEGGVEVGGLITVNQHNFAPTKAQPEGWKGENWPKGMGAVCRHDVAFEGIYDECYICDVVIPAQVDEKARKRLVAKPRSYAFAMEREQVLADGVLQGCNTVMETITRNEQEIQVPKIILVNMAWNNFFADIAAMAEVYQTVLDRDLVITRKGAEWNNTEYHSVALERDGLDMRDAALAAQVHAGDYCPRGDLWEEYDLERLVSHRASDDWYALWFDPNKQPNFGSGSDSSPSSPSAPTAPAVQQAKPASTEDPAVLAALADRIKGTGTNEGQVAPAPAAAPAQPAPAASLFPSS